MAFKLTLLALHVLLLDWRHLSPLQVECETSRFPEQLAAAEPEQEAEQGQRQRPRQQEQSPRQQQQRAPVVQGPKKQGTLASLQPSRALSFCHMPS